MIWLDTESVGFIGPTVLLQWAQDDGPIHLHSVFSQPVRETLRICELLCDHPGGVGGFNLTHDWFHIARLWNVLRRLPTDKPPALYAWYENLRPASIDALCLKPVTCLDLMLHARKGPMQSLMERDDIRVRRVPALLAPALCEELTSRLKLPSIYFERRTDGAAWKVQADPDDPDFPNVYLSFGASGGLKSLARHVLGAETVDYPIPHEYLPKQESWRHWQELPSWMVYYHVAFWENDQTARRYATQDVELLRGLWRAWGNPPAGDHDSVLTCQVGAARWRGWSLNLPLVERHLDAAIVEAERVPDRNAHARILTRLQAAAGPELACTIENTAAETLEVLSKLESPVGAIAREVAGARTADKRADMLQKLKYQGRAMFDFKVIGTLSNRKAGAGGINAQGVEQGELRECFTLADPSEFAEGGDFDGFEVTITDAVYKDPGLHADLVAGKKVHAQLGADMYEEDPDVVKASDKARGAAQVRDPLGRGWDGDLYNPSKHMVFTLIYGGQAPKVAETGRLPLETAEAGLHEFLHVRYPLVGAGMAADEALFCSMTQPNGPGTRVVWRDPAEKIESLLGFARYFTLENLLVRFLFDLANHLPESLRSFEKGVRVQRRREGRSQTPGGAVCSALYGSAFNLQARNSRAARNHRIQATGAGITKGVEVAIWEHQPAGIHPWRVRAFNVHDEIPTATVVKLNDTVQTAVERYRAVVPLLKIDWKSRVPHWGGIK